MAQTDRIIVGKQGRIVIPAGLRTEAHIHEGMELRAHVSEEGQLIIDTPESIKDRIRARAAKGRAMPGNVVDELLDERSEDRSLLDR